jgi:hypothetical protein
MEDVKDLQEDYSDGGLDLFVRVTVADIGTSFDLFFLLLLLQDCGITSRIIFSDRRLQTSSGLNS